MRLATISYLSGLLLMAVSAAQAQKENALIRKGNNLYRQQQIDQSQQQYQKAIQLAPDNPAANYNLGNTQFRKNNFDDAAKSYDAATGHSADQTVQEKALYNKGVSLIRQQKLPESIDAWKQSLKLDPNDTEARENLQKALLEQNKNKSKDQKNDPKKQKQEPKKEQQPKEQQSRLSKQQVEQLLRALQQREKEVQDKLNQNKVKSLTQPDKDW